MTDCTAGGGTQIFDCSMLRGLTFEAVVAIVTDFLRESRWDGEAPLMVIQWLPAQMSPSIQLWIPPPPSPVVCEGVFEQQFFPSNETRFAGGVLADLPDPIHRPLVDQGILIGTLLQRLGYRGRCSMDSIVLDCDSDTPRIYFIECNARWGGISIPMTLMNRVLGYDHDRRYICAANEDSRFRGMGFSELRTILKDYLYPAMGEQRGIVMYNIECLESSDRFDIVSFAEARLSAQALFNEVKQVLRNA